MFPRILQGETANVVLDFTFVFFLRSLTGMTCGMCEADYGVLAAQLDPASAVQQMKKKRKWRGGNVRDSVNYREH